MPRKNPERRQQPGATHYEPHQEPESKDHYFKTARLVARSPGQRHYIRTIRGNHVTICTGPAGSGKTHIACGLASEAFRKGEVDRIILSRPIGTVENDLGYLPGDIINKMDPYLRPLFDELGCYLTREAIKHLISVGTVEIIPLSAMRGRTFKDAFVILDEAQNATYAELKMFFTRFGEGSRVVASGDLKQSDIPEDALSAVIDRIYNLHGVGICHLDYEDVVRHRLTSEIDRSL